MQARVASRALRTAVDAVAMALLAPAAPLMIAQGRRVRREALRLPEADGPRQGLRQPPDAPRLLILGDSSAAGVGVGHQSLALSGRLLELLVDPAIGSFGWRLIARTGVAARDLPVLIDQQLGAPSATGEPDMAELPPSRFDVALVVVGVNDVTSGTPIRRWIDALDRVHQRLQAVGVRHAVFSGLPPMEHFSALPQPLRSWLGLQARRYDRALSDWCALRAGTSHLALPRLSDRSLLASDGFHPGEAGCALWARELAPLLIPKLREARAGAGVST